MASVALEHPEGDNPHTFDAVDELRAHVAPSALATWWDHVHPCHSARISVCIFRFFSRHRHSWSTENSMSFAALQKQTENGRRAREGPRSTPPPVLKRPGVVRIRCTGCYGARRCTHSLFPPGVPARDVHQRHVHYTPARPLQSIPGPTRARKLSAHRKHQHGGACPTLVVLCPEARRCPASPRRDFRVGFSTRARKTNMSKWSADPQRRPRPDARRLRTPWSNPEDTRASMPHHPCCAVSAPPGLVDRSRRRLPTTPTHGRRRTPSSAPAEQPPCDGDPVPSLSPPEASRLGVRTPGS